MAALTLGFAADCAEAQTQQAQVGAVARPAPAPQSRTLVSRTELARQFTDNKNQYATIKTAVAKYAPLKADAPPELRTTRLKIDAAMRSYDRYEGRAQRQRDQLNLLVAYGEFDSKRFRASMERLAKLRAGITELMKRVNESGDALIKTGGGTNAAAVAVDAGAAHDH